MGRLCIICDGNFWRRIRNELFASSLKKVGGFLGHFLWSNGKGEFGEQ